MLEIIKLYFSQNNKDQYLLICAESKDLETLTLTDFVEIHYHGGVTYRMSKNTLGYMLNFELLEMLNDVIHNNLVLDESITKSLGYYQAQIYENSRCKHLKYITGEDGDLYWVGGKHNLFDFAYAYQQETWLYNDKEGKIWFELSPVYPWFFADSEEGETVIPFRQWLKNFKPYVVRKISKETAKQWVKQLQDLLKVIEENDKRLSCTGPGCKLCKEEGSELYKQYCSCERGEEIHKNS